MSDDRYLGCEHIRPHNHGEYLTYLVHDCHCDACRAAWAKRCMRESHVRYRQGGTSLVPINAEVVDKLKYLVAHGVSLRLIADRVGVSKTTIIRTLAGTFPRGQQRALQAVSSLTLGDFHTKIGAQRRIRALCVMGWPLRIIAKQTGLRSTVVQAIAGGVHTGYHTVYDAIAEFYDRSWDESPETVGVPEFDVRQTRLWALSKGWNPPLAWDDDTIDDPESEPQGVDDSDQFLVVRRLENVEWLIANGESRYSALIRCGWTKWDSFSKACRRNGRSDLQARVKADDKVCAFDRHLAAVQLVAMSR